MKEFIFIACSLFIETLRTQPEKEIP